MGSIYKKKLRLKISCHSPFKQNNRGRKSHDTVILIKWYTVVHYQLCNELNMLADCRPCYAQESWPHILGDEK